MGLQVLKTVFRFGLTVLGISIIGCTGNKVEVPYYNTPDFSPIWYSEGKDTLHKIADFSFINQYGQVVSDKSLNGKIWVSNFFFTKCPKVCPAMTKNLKIVADAFGNNSDIVILSHSVTPETDSVAKLKEYAELNGIEDKQWQLLTGDKTAIYMLARRSYFAEEEIGLNADATEFLHTEHVLLVDKERHLRGIYNGTIQLEMERLKEDISKLLNE